MLLTEDYQIIQINVIIVVQIAGAGVWQRFRNFKFFES